MIVAGTAAWIGVAVLRAAAADSSASAQTERFEMGFMIGLNESRHVVLSLKLKCDRHCAFDGGVGGGCVAERKESKGSWFGRTGRFSKRDED